MKNPLNILFLGGAKRVSLAEHFIKAAQQKNLQPTIFSYELNQDVPISFVGKIIIGKKWNDSGLISHLQETIASENINIVLPFVDPAIAICAELKNVVNKNIFIPVSEKEVCNIFFNKRTAEQWCQNNNIASPNNISNFPLIAKPVFGSASKGIEKIESVEQLERYKNNQDYIIQKFVDAEEYTIDCYISPQARKIISVVPRIRLETQGGESIKTVTRKDTEIMLFCENIISKSGVVGPITIQLLKEKATGKLYFMELNPRFGGAVVASIGAGANSAEYLINDYLGVQNQKFDSWEDNFLMVRRFSEYFRKIEG